MSGRLGPTPIMSTVMERWPLLVNFRYLGKSLGQEISALMVKLSGQTDIVGKDMNEHIANSSIPAKTRALEYTGSEVLSKSNKIALINECTHVTFSFRATRKKQE